MLKIIVDWGISMEWDKERRYTYRDYLKWAEAGYMGMELIDGVPYQYGVSVFEQDPFPVSPESRRGICERLCYRFTQCLANTEYNAHQSYPVRLGKAQVRPDIVLNTAHENNPVLVVEMAAPDKHERLGLCREANADYWVIYPDMQLINVYTKDGGRVYEAGDHIPVAMTGRIVDLEGIWSTTDSSGNGGDKGK